MNKDGNNVLLLLFDEKEFLSVKANKRDVDVNTAFKKFKSIFVLAIRKYYLELRLPHPEIWFGDWIKSIKKNNYDVVIIHASNSSRFIADYIQKKINTRVIFWYWNPVARTVDPNKITNPKIEKWSFDMDDCKIYNMKYNTQYYFNDIDIDSNVIKQDIFFVGADKGRLDDILKLEKQFNSLNLSTYFHITQTYLWSITKPKSVYKSRISYEKVLQHISQSKAILDIVQKNQSGLTLRPMEALMFSKKLITNDTKIVGYDFYCKDNIFILGKDKIEDLPQFINSTFNPVNDSLIKKYDFSSWVSRFL